MDRNNREFIVGDNYFLVTYHDRALSLPSIETYVFLGKDIFGETDGSDPRWYFQTAESYAISGPFDPRADNSGFNSADNIVGVGEDMIDSFGDADAMYAKLTRRSAE